VYFCNVVLHEMSYIVSENVHHNLHNLGVNHNHCVREHTCMHVEFIYMHGMISTSTQHIINLCVGSMVCMPMNIIIHGTCALLRIMRMHGQ